MSFLIRFWSMCPQFTHRFHAHIKKVFPQNPFNGISNFVTTCQLFEFFTVKTVHCKMKVIPK